VRPSQDGRRFLGAAGAIPPCAEPSFAELPIDVEPGTYRPHSDHPPGSRGRAAPARRSAVGLAAILAKDAKLSYSTFNARAEEIATKPVFRDAFKRRRCLIPLDAFYEWKQIGPKEKQPYAFALKTGGAMAMAGLYENWRSPAGENVPSAPIITCPPNDLVAELHNRMPVILPPETWPTWLGEELAEPAELQAMLASYPAERMTCWPVDKRVGNVKNNGPSLIEPN
jgi:putative SOS response-associated peptidase YedK